MNAFTNNFIRPSIVGLLFSGSPSAILSGIISIVVDALYRGVGNPKFLNMSEERLVHIVSKVKEGLPKALYTSASVVRIVFGVLIASSPLNSVIGVIKFSLNLPRFTLYKAMSGATFYSHLNSQTPAGTRVPFYQVVYKYLNDISAIAFAKSERVTSSLRRYSPYHGQHSEFLTRSIYKSHNGILYHYQSKRKYFSDYPVNIPLCG